MRKTSIKRWKHIKSAECIDFVWNMKTTKCRYLASLGKTRSKTSTLLRSIRGYDKTDPRHSITNKKECCKLDQTFKIKLVKYFKAHVHTIHMQISIKILT